MTHESGDFGHKRPREMGEARTESTSPGRRDRDSQRKAFVALTAATVVSVLAVGSLHTESLVVSTLALGVTLLLLGNRQPALRSNARIVLLVAVGLTAFTAFQLLPLPMGLLEALAPTNARTWQKAFSPLGKPGPRFAALTVDIPGTTIQVLRGIAYCFAFLAAVRLGRRPTQAIRLEWLLAGSAFGLALVSLAHPILGIDRVFGVYAPENVPAGRYVGPLLNPNHLAGYLTLGALCAFSRLLCSRSESLRSVAGALLAVLVATNAWVGSRGGVGAMVLGLVLVAVLQTIARRRDRTARSLFPVLGGTFLGLSGLVLLVLALEPGVVADVMDKDLSKLSLVTEAFGGAKGYALLGAGRGAFQSAFYAYRQTPGFVDYTHPENWPAQWCFEWGFPVAFAAAGTLAFALRPSALFARTVPPVGAYAGLVAANIHNLVDFHNEVPGVMIALAIAAGAVLGGEASPTAVRPRIALGRYLRPAVGAVMVVVAVLGLWVRGKSVREERAHYRQWAQGMGPSSASEARRLFDELVATLGRHPAEPFFPYIGALVAQRTGAVSPLPWVGGVIERSRYYGPAKLVLAQALRTKSPPHARLAYRQAIEEGIPDGYRALEEAVTLVETGDDAEDLVPRGGSVRPIVLDGLVRMTEARLPATAVGMDAELLAAPRDTAPVVRFAHRLALDLKDSVWCESDRKSCVASAAALGERMARLDGAGCDVLEARAALLTAAEMWQEAGKGLREAGASAADPTRCWIAMLAVARASGRPDVWTEAVSGVARAACPTEATCSQRVRIAAAAEEERGNNASALRLYREAIARGEDGLEVLERTADVASRSGLHAEAMQLFERAQVRDPGNPRWKPLIERERGRLRPAGDGQPR